MAVMLPHKTSTAFVVGLVLVDLPVTIVIAAAGIHYGFADTYKGVNQWRLAHPWSFAPSLVLAGVLIWRWRRAGRHH
jgi:hypothetical protein